MKKIFRMALVFALAGATLVYTGCTKDYAEEIGDLNKELAKTQDELKSVKDALAKAEALAEAAATKSDFDKEVSALNTAISNLRTALEGDIADLGGDITDLENEIADLWEAIDNLETALDEKIQALDEKIEGEDGLRKAINEAKAAIAAIFNQIQSVVFVPEYVNEGIVFSNWKIGDLKLGDSTAIATFKVNPAAKATEVGKTYELSALVQPLKTKSVAEPTSTKNVTVIKADPATGYVELAIALSNVKAPFAVSLGLTETESGTNINSNFVPAEFGNPIDLAKKFKLFSKTAESYSTIEIRYDDTKTYNYFDSFYPAFDINDTEYSREDIAKAFPKVSLTWADTVKVTYPTGSKAEAFVVSDTTANFPAKVKLAKAATDTAFNYVGQKAVADYTVTFTTSSLRNNKCKFTDFADQTAKIVESYSNIVITTDDVKFAWNYQSFDGEEFADNSLPAPNVGNLANKEKSDFCDNVTFKGYIDAAKYATAKAKGVDSLLAAAFANPCDFFEGNPTLKYKNASTVDFALKKSNVWPKADTNIVAVWNFFKDETNYALAVPVTVTAKPADKTFAYADSLDKKDESYTLAAAFDSIYTEAFANKLVDGLSGQTAAKANAKEELADSLANPITKVSAKINDLSLINPFVDLFGAEWDSNVEDIDITFTEVKYSDKVTAEFFSTAFGVKFTFKVTLTTEKEPGYKFGFIDDPRLTAVSANNAIAYAALTSEGIPEDAYMNQLVRVVRPAGVTNAIFNRDALKVKFNVVKPAKDTLKLNTASVASKANFAQTDEYSVQSSWSATADTTLAYIGADKHDPLAKVEWKECIADTIPVKAVLYCDAAPIDSVIVKVYTDNPFAGEGAFKGYDFVFDASERNNADVTMGNLHIYDSVTVKSNLAVFANTNFVCPNFYQHHVAITGGTHNTYNCSVDGDGVVTGSCSSGLTHYGNPQNFYAQYKATGEWKASAENLNLELKIAPVSEWTYGNGSAVEDNPTNLKPEFAKGQITLLKGNKLTEDLVVTIPIELTYRYSQKPLTSQVTVTFTK